MTQLAILQHLVNQAGVLERLAPGMASVDMSGFFLRPGNFMLGDENGAALFGMISPGVYEGHYLLPERSVDKMGRCRAFINTVFTDHFADAIVGHTPVEDRAARVMSRALGFTRRGTSVTASGRSCVDYVLERREWETLSAGSWAALARSQAQSSNPTQPRTPERTLSPDTTI